jgi:hypothetical protein
VKKCVKQGKWVKREHRQRGKGFHVYYAFDENLCAEYESDYFSSGEKQTAIFNKSSGSTNENEEEDKPKISRKKKKPSRIWMRDEDNLRPEHF